MACVWYVAAVQVLQTVGSSQPQSDTQPASDSHPAADAQPAAAHGDAVLYIAAHPNRPMLVSCGHEKDMTAKLWQHRPLEPEDVPMTG